MVGRPLVGDLERRRQRLVDDEAGGVGEDPPEHGGRRLSLEGAVKLAHEVGRREVHAAVGRVGRR